MSIEKYRQCLDQISFAELVSIYEDSDTLYLKNKEAYHMVWTTINGSIDDDWLQIYMNFRVQKEIKEIEKNQNVFRDIEKKSELDILEF